MKHKASKRKRKWIQKAIKRPGRITRLCQQMGHKKVTEACLEKLKKRAKKTGDRSLMSAVNLAKRFRSGDLSRRKKS